MSESVDPSQYGNQKGVSIQHYLINMVHNLKQQVPSDIPVHNQYIPAEQLESQKWLNTINDWTLKQKMLVNEKKTKK